MANNAGRRPPYVTDAGGVTVYQVADVDEAIELAQRLQAEGQYQWSRGQVQAWPPHSSLLRLQLRNSENADVQHVQLVQRLRHWMHATPGLEALAADADAFFAIAQHHGIATHLIDFCTDPAVGGFFSADTKEPVAQGTASCIYCLHLENLAKLWARDQGFRKEHMNEDLPNIRFITPQVPNLWRMQAQTGVFLQCGINWEVVYPMDRIEFLYTGYPSFPTRAAIYPSRRSELELLLDQFFDNEQKLRGGEVMRGMLAELRAKGVNVAYAEAEAHEDLYMPEVFRDGQLPFHPSWAAQTPWLAVGEERHDDVRHLQIAMVLDLQAAPTALRKRARSGFEQALKRHPDARQHAVHWHISNIAPGAAPPSAELAKGLGRLWDGMRRQPFTDAQLALALATWASLCCAGYAREGNSEIAVAVFGGPVVRLEFRAADGASSRGYATEAGLRAALRDDLSGLFADDAWCQRAGQKEHLLQMCYCPQRLSIFDRLLDLFVAEVGPTQLNRDEPFFFHPARLQILGLP